MEIWGNVEGQEGLFKISNFGKVKSFKNKKDNDAGRIIKPCIDGRGYCNFTIRVNGMPKVLLVHREVAKCFVPNPNNYKLVRHLNDIKLDNRAENLAWGTHSDNINDAILNKKIKPKMSVSPAIIKFIAFCGYRTRAVANRFSISISTVHKIRSGRAWSSATGIYFVNKKQ